MCIRDRFGGCDVELLLGDLVDLVDHEDVLLEAPQELLEARLRRPLLLQANRYQLNGLFKYLLKEFTLELLQQLKLLGELRSKRHGCCFRSHCKKSLGSQHGQF